jgi:hypothetical protein
MEIVFAVSVDVDRKKCEEHWWMFFSDAVA